jgi:23S rRNA (guanosine2251-2'-O)-methyltransferase
MNQLYGLSPVLEALRSRRRTIHKIVLAAGANPSRLQELIEAARRAGITIEKRDRRALDELARGANHQGVIALVAASNPRSAYVEAETILDSLGATPLVVLLDGIEDPHNLGAILRTCEGAGVDGVFIPEHRAAGLNETVAKTSAGAVEYVRVARVTNLIPLIEELKTRGLWVAGVEGGTDTVYSDFDLKTPLALVLGSEGKGLRRLVRERCDAVLSIPMLGRINSLNVSVAAGVVLFEVLRQRGLNSRPLPP